MERYITQLIDDLHQITSVMNPDDEPEPEDMSYVDDYLYGERYPISQITTIATEQLPPPEKLSPEQQALLAFELEDFLLYFHFCLDFPHDYPFHLRYPFIRNIWEDEHVAMKFGRTHIEFCEYDEEQCPFLEYCHVCDDVKEMDTSMQDSNQIKDENIEEFGLFDEGDDLPYAEDINGFYDDNGNKIDLNTIPVPPLCTICKNNHVDDWHENLLCLMNRNDQRNKKEFVCGAFQKE
jgi:hypothetical protein